MTESVFEYIKILLPQHKCVTLPGLGAFILNKEEGNSFDLGKAIIPPSYSITFNSRLQHDDGVLSSYIQTIKGASYDKVNKELTNTIRKMRANLLVNKIASCGSLGKLELTESNIIFTQNNNYIFPLHYGLTAVGLTNISTINKEVDKETKTISLKRRLITISASAAAILFLFLPSTNITDNNAVANQQQAGYLQSLITSNPKSEVIEQPISQPIIEDIQIIPENNITIPENVVNIPEPIRSTSISKSVRTYYLIIGGESSASMAEKTLNRFKQEGFDNVQILESPQRYRIYVNTFDNKQEAERYLIQFRKQNPKYESAWVHSMKN